MNRNDVKDILVSARKNGYALPAINVSNLDTAIAAFEGFEGAHSPGIIQISIGSAKGASRNGDPVEGSIVLGRMLNQLKKQYDVPVILHTDHCHYQYVDTWLKPLLTRLHEIMDSTGEKIFDSFMFDGSMTDIETNATTIEELAPLVKSVDGFLEVEAGGQWGGSEDGIGGGAKYSTPDDVRRIQNAMTKAGWGDHDYLLAIAFGNSHGTATIANLKPSLLHDISVDTGKDNLYVFHGGSGSSIDDIHAAVSNGVVKMNIDTDTQYYFTQGVVDFFEHAPKAEDGTPVYRSHRDGKKFFDPRAWNKAGRESMKNHVIEVAEYLHSEGRIHE